MNKITKLIFIAIIMSFMIVGCKSNKDDNSSVGSKQPNYEVKESTNSGEIIANAHSKTTKELIDIIEATTTEDISMSKEERYELKKQIYLDFEDETIIGYINDISGAYTMLTSIIENDKYKELFDKSNPRWDYYEDNKLFGIPVSMENICSVIDNNELKNDLNRVKKLCSYGIENRDIIALIDARRIVRDIEVHLISVPGIEDTEEFLDRKENSYSENDYNIYYGASEILEGDTYNTVGLYKYN